MRKPFKRVLSFLIVLALIVSVFACMLTASAAPRYNNGKFGVVCKSLSSQAKAYYTGSYTYEKLSAQSGTTLKNSISALVTKDRNTGSYNSLKENFAYTDAVNGSSSKLRLFYCGVTANSAWEGDTNFNREHMWPDSKGGSAAEGDLHSMRPTDKDLNSARGNYPYGEVTNGTAKYSNSNHGKVLGGYLGGGYFEPLDNVKGDVARAILYDYCTYSSLSNLSLVFQSTDVMLAWIKLDPVDEFEMSRNDVVEGIQDCRNPFVDYPELAYLVFNKEIPSDMVTPSGEAMNGAPSYTITVVSGNPDFGTVSLNGKTITATPKTGYTVAGYEVTPAGAATVTQSGNTFTVSNIKADCTITINFAAKTAATITYIVPNGVTVNGTTASYVGDSVKLASVSGTPTGTTGYSFFGWATRNIVDTTVLPSVQKAGASYTVKEAQTTFYAVFSYLDGTTTHYLSNPCKHESTHIVTLNPTCTDNGATNVVCDTCGTIISSTPIAKTGHSYKDNVVAPTCDEKGYTEHVCTVCGDSYKNTFVAALGHDYVSKVTKPATDTEEGVLTYSCTRCDSSYTEVIPATAHDCPCDDFSDLDNTRWYHEGVDLMLNMGYMNGVGNGRFDPNGSTTRAMIVTIIWRMEGKPAPSGKNTFTDVQENVWYTDAITWAAENNVVNGMGNNKFDPNGRITREQMATILFRYAGGNGADTSARANLGSFPDGGKVQSWAKDAVQWAVAEEIIKGDGALLQPQGTATRAQAATILFRSMDLFTK